MSVKEEMFNRMMEKAIEVDAKTLKLAEMDFSKFSIMGIKREKMKAKGIIGIHMMASSSKFASEQMMKEADCTFYVIETDYHRSILEEYGHDPDSVRDSGPEEDESTPPELAELPEQERLLLKLFAGIMGLDAKTVGNMFIVHHMVQLKKQMTDAIENDKNTKDVLAMYMKKLGDEL